MSPSSGARAARLGLLAALCRCGGETDEAPRVLVHVGGLDATVERLLVTATLEGKRAERAGEITGHLDSFVVELPRGSRGRLTIDIEALLNDGSCRLVEAHTTGTLRSSGLVESDVTLATTADDRCLLEVAVSGDGAVTAASAATPGAGLGCADGACRGRFVRGDSVTVTALPGPGTTEVTWGESQCQNGQTVCQVALTGPVRLSLGFRARACSAGGFCAYGGDLAAGQSFNAVWGRGADDVWLVGDLGAAAHFDGVRWSPIPLPTPDPPPDPAQFPAGDGARTAVHAYALGGWGPSPGVFAGTEQGYLFRHDGSRWEQVWWAPPDAGKRLNLRSVHFVSATLGAVTGDRAQLYYRQTDTDWQGQLGLFAQKVFWDVWFSPTRVWVVGSDGLIAYGTHLSTDLTPVTPPAGKLRHRAIWGTSDSDIWVAGDRGTLAHYDGTTWALDPQSAAETWVNDDISDIWGTAPGDYWAVGEHGLILHYDGASWSEVTSGTDARLGSVWGSSAGDVWVVGEGSTILRRRP